MHPARVPKGRRGREETRNRSGIPVRRRAVAVGPRQSGRRAPRCGPPARQQARSRSASSGSWADGHGRPCDRQERHAPEQRIQNTSTRSSITVVIGRFFTGRSGLGVSRRGKVTSLFPRAAARVRGRSCEAIVGEPGGLARASPERWGHPVDRWCRACFAETLPCVTVVWCTTASIRGRCHRVRTHVLRLCRRVKGVRNDVRVRSLALARHRRLECQTPARDRVETAPARRRGADAPPRSHPRGLLTRPAPRTGRPMAAARARRATHCRRPPAEISARRSPPSASHLRALGTPGGRSGGLALAAGGARYWVAIRGGDSAIWLSVFIVQLLLWT